MFRSLRDHQKIKIKLLVVLLAAITPFLIFIFYLFDLWYDTRRQLVIDENITTARLIATNINQSFQIGESTAVMVADQSINQVSQDTQPLRNTDELQEFVKGIQNKGSDLKEVGFFDLAGNIIATSVVLTPEREKANIADRAYFQETIRTKKPSRSGVVFGKLTGQYIIAHAAPVLQEGVVRAVTVSTFDVVQLKTKLESTLTNKNRVIILVDSEKHVAFRLFEPLEQIEKLQSITGNPHVQVASQGIETLFDFESFPAISATERFIGVTAPMGNQIPHWVVVSMQPLSQIYAPLLQLQSSMWIILGSALIFSFALVSYVIRKIRVIY